MSKAHFRVYRSKIGPIAKRFLASVPIDRRAEMSRRLAIAKAMKTRTRDKEPT